MASHNMDTILKNLKEISKAPNVGEKIQRNQMLLVALSTTMMLAKKVPLPKEHYQWTRLFLNGIRDENGRRIENLVGLVAEMDRFEQELNIEDELIDAKVANEPEPALIATEDSSDDDSIEIPAGAPRSTATQDSLHFSDNQDTLDNQADPSYVPPFNNTTLTDRSVTGNQNTTEGNADQRYVPPFNDTTLTDRSVTGNQNPPVAKQQAANSAPSTSGAAWKSSVGREKLKNYWAEASNLQRIVPQIFNFMIKSLMRKNHKTKPFLVEAPVNQKPECRHDNSDPKLFPRRLTRFSADFHSAEPLIMDILVSVFISASLSSHSKLKLFGSRFKWFRLSQPTPFFSTIALAYAITLPPADD